MSNILDPIESQSAEQREAFWAQQLPRQIAHAQANSPAMRELLAGVDATRVSSRAALARLPVVRKSELLARQQAARAAGADALGGFAVAVRGKGVKRIYASPGPIYEPEGDVADYWRVARALFAAGFREGDLVHNSFSYHMTPGAYLMESGAFALGCTVFPGGVGQTEQQLAAIADLKPNAYCGTPSFLRILVEKAAETGVSISSLTKAMVSGEAFPPSLRDWLAGRGITAYQSYATADVGMIAFETAAREGLVVDEGVLLEIVRPGTNEPVADGEVGEVVVTTLNATYPLIRFGTGDLSAVLPGTCPTGRTNMRIKGWMGRADQTAKVRGMFVHAAQVGEIAKRFPEVAKARLIVSGEMANDQLKLVVEAASKPEGFEAKVAEAVREVTKLRADIECVAVGSLPNDGKVIEDARSYN